MFPINVKSEIAHASVARHSNPMEKAIFIEDLAQLSFNHMFHIDVTDVTDVNPYFAIYICIYIYIYILYAYIVR